MEKIELADFLHYRMLSEATYAPGGGKAAFLVKEADTENDSYRSDIWLYESGSVSRLTESGKETRFLWLDEETLLFTSDREKKAEAGPETYFYQIDIHTKEERPLFRLPLAVSGMKLFDRKKLLLYVSIDRACPDYISLSEEEQKNYLERKKEEADYLVIDELPYRYNGAGYTNGTRNALFLCDLASGSAERITSVDTKVYLYEVYGKKVAYTACSPENMWFCFPDVFLYDPETGGTECIYDKKDYRFWCMESAGDSLLFKGAKRDNPYGLMCGRDFLKYTEETYGGGLAEFAHDELTLGSNVGSDCRLGGGRRCKAVGDLFYYIHTKGTSAVLAALDQDGNVREVFEKEGSMDCFDVDEKNGKALAVCLYGNHLQELYKIDLKTGACDRVSSFNDEILEGKYVAACDRITVPSHGEQIDGFILRPKDYDPEKSYPAILDIHGGPKVAYGEVFYHEMQCWANAGYFVLFCNPIGSDGKGDAFADINTHIGRYDYENIMDFTDAVLERYPQIDQSRLGITGGSYGGFMTNWVIGHTDRFACAASQRSISNWFTSYGLSDIGYWSTWEESGGNMYGDYQAVWDSSPLKYAENVVTPTLFLHSTQDFRCDISEGLQMLTALLDKGVPARMCVFEGENHELSRSGKPSHRLRRLQEITEWMDHYLKPQERPERRERL